MPNGGFGCGYCVFLDGRYCKLRKTKIRNDHWVVCANVTYYENLGPARLQRFSYRPFPEITGSIYTITGVEGAYSQIPWLGKNQVYGRLKPGSSDEYENFTCDVCKRKVVEPRNLYLKKDGNARKYYFCSWNHYLRWRNEMIQNKVVEDELASSEKIASYTDFTDLEIIANNSSRERRIKSNRIYLMRKLIKYVFIFTGLVTAFKLDLF